MSETFPLTDAVPYAATHESARRLTLVLNDISTRLTTALAQSGHVELTSNNDVIVLADLSLHGPRRPRSLLEVTDITSGGLSILLERLEDAGLITRRYGAIPGDRRGVLIELTEAGTATIAEMDASVAQAIVELDPLLDEFTDLLDAFPAPADEPSPATVRPESQIERMVLLGQLGNTIIAALADPDYDDDLTQALTAIVLCRTGVPGGARPRDLVPVTGLSRSGVTQLLKQMEAAGLIARTTRRLSDRRGVSITLTPDGWQSLETRLAHIAEQAGAAREVLALLRA